MGKKSNGELRKAREQQVHHFAMAIHKKQSAKPVMKVGESVEAHLERIKAWKESL